MIDQALSDVTNPHLADVTYETLKEKRFMKASGTGDFLTQLRTPSGKIELYSEQMERDGYPPLPTYIPILQDSDYPFLYVPAINHNFMNTIFSDTEKHRKLEKAPRLFMNHTMRNCVELKMERLSGYGTSVGNVKCTVTIGEQVLSGVVVSQGFWPSKPGEKNLVNALTPDRIADMGGGATFFSGRVDVEVV